MTPNLASLKTRLASPAASLAMGLALAIVAALLPERTTTPIRGLAADLLRPGQTVAVGLRHHAANATAWVQRHFHTAAQLAEAEAKLERLKQENTRLAAELAAAENRPPAAGPTADEDPLLTAHCVPGRVLGRQARAFLARQQLLDVGAAAGVEPDALVVDYPALIDRGRDAQVEPGQLVLAAGRVWGKIVERGAHTSVVRAATEPGYRDLVTLGKSPGIQGILEGSGEPLARIRLVEVTQPVAVGDAVYTAAGKGVLPTPLLCGTIVRVEQPVGAAYWDLWMQPAVTAEPERVAVLRIEVNPARVDQRADPSTGPNP